MPLPLQACAPRPQVAEQRTPQEPAEAARGADVEHRVVDCSAHAPRAAAGPRRSHGATFVGAQPPRQGCTQAASSGAHASASATLSPGASRRATTLGARSATWATKTHAGWLAGSRWRPLDPIGANVPQWIGMGRGIPLPGPCVETTVPPVRRAIAAPQRPPRRGGARARGAARRDRRRRDRAQGAAALIRCRGSWPSERRTPGR
jgi:hypothetical protein